MASIRHILVIEDDAAVKAAIARVNLGDYIDLEFASLAEAVEKSGTYIAVLANDSVMLGGGEHLPVTLLKKKFECPIILMTSAGNRRIEGYAKESGCADVLFKPFGLAELRRQLRNLPQLGDGNGSGIIDALAADSLKSSNPAATDVGGRIAGEQAFDYLFDEIEKRQPLPEEIDAFDVVEQHLIKRALQSCQGNQSQTARFLGITRNTLRKRIRKYGFSALLTGDDRLNEEDP